MFGLIALGGNQGDVPQTMRGVLEKLDRDAETRVLAVSGFHQTQPMGTATREPFWNGCARIETSLTPRQLLARLKDLEYQAGRRPGQRWDARPLDLDIVACEDLILDEPDLRIPHPGCWYRRFVLDPLVEIAGETVHPEKQLAFAALRDRLLTRPLPVLLSGIEFDATLRESWLSRFPQVAFFFALNADGRQFRELALAFHCEQHQLRLPPDADPRSPWVDGRGIPGDWEAAVSAALGAALGE